MTDQEEMCGKLENIHFAPKTTQDLLTKRPLDGILIQLLSSTPLTALGRCTRKPRRTFFQEAKALRRTMRNSTEAKFKYSLRCHRFKGLTTKFPFYG